jgi:Cu2+-containing amine oxidase
MGEVGMGFSANPLTLGCDCLGEIYYFDGTVNDSSGNAVTIPNVICMHEADYGISWKHTDFRTGEVEVRRARRLVISMICTVGNYEYGFVWYFYNDASHTTTRGSPATLWWPRRRTARAIGTRRFDGNPALDIPPSPPASCHHH